MDVFLSSILEETIRLNQESDSLSLTFSGKRDNQEVNGLQDVNVMMGRPIRGSWKLV